MAGSNLYLLASSSCLHDQMRDASCEGTREEAQRRAGQDESTQHTAAGFEALQWHTVDLEHTARVLLLDRVVAVHLALVGGD